MVLSLIAATVALSNDGVLNGGAGGPSRAHNTVKSVAGMVGMALYAPDDTARGYSLTNIEYVKVGSDSSMPGLKDRYAVRMSCVNNKTKGAFDIFQSRGGGSVSPERHMQWLVGSGLFEFAKAPQDTFVAIKRGDVDIAFVGGLVSQPSAKELLSRTVLIKP